MGLVGLAAIGTRSALGSHRRIETSAFDYSDDGQMAFDDTASTKGHVTTYTLTPLPRLPAPSSMVSVRVPMNMGDDDEIKFKR